MRFLDDEVDEALINAILDALDISLHRRVVRAAQEALPTHLVTYNEKTCRVLVESY